MPPAVRSEKVPANMQAVYNGVISLTDPYCREHLNEEYATLCREMAAALARKRPSPLLGGQLLTWTCGIVYAVGQINYLFLKRSNPHVSPADLCAAFGFRPTTASNKAKEIRDLLGIRELGDPAWTLPSQLGRNPGAWRAVMRDVVKAVRKLTPAEWEEARRRASIPSPPPSSPEDAD